MNNRIIKMTRSFTNFMRAGIAYETCFLWHKTIFKKKERQNDNNNNNKKKKRNFTMNDTNTQAKIVNFMYKRAFQSN